MYHDVVADSVASSGNSVPPRFSCGQRRELVTSSRTPPHDVAAACRCGVCIKAAAGKPETVQEVSYSRELVNSYIYIQQQQQQQGPDNARQLRYLRGGYICATLLPFTCVLSLRRTTDFYPDDMISCDIITPRTFFWLGTPAGGETLKSRSTAARP